MNASYTLARTGDRGGGGGGDRQSVDRIGFANILLLYFVTLPWQTVERAKKVGNGRIVL